MHKKDETVASPSAPSAPDAEGIAHLARLSRLRISPAEAEDAARAVGDILRMMGRLREADISGEDDTTHVQFRGETLRLREDAARPGFGAARLTENAPAAADGYFVVPKVIE